MCKIIGETKRKSVTGYKAVLRIGKNIYSPATGLKYIVGMRIPKMKKKRKLAEYSWVDFLNVNSDTYSPKMQGRTAIFKNLKDIKNHPNFETAILNGTYEVVKMTLGGEIFEGTYASKPTFVGSEILEIQTI